MLASGEFGLVVVRVCETVSLTLFTCSLREVKAAEQRKLAREEARNVLEAFIYKVRDLVEQASFVGASLEHERKVIKEKTEEVNEWLWDEGESAATKELKSKKNDLECVDFWRQRWIESVWELTMILVFQETCQDYLYSCHRSRHPTWTHRQPSRDPHQLHRLPHFGRPQRFSRSRLAQVHQGRTEFVVKVGRRCQDLVVGSSKEARCLEGVGGSRAQGCGSREEDQGLGERSEEAGEEEGTEEEEGFE